MISTYWACDYDMDDYTSEERNIAPHPFYFMHDNIVAPMRVESIRIGCSPYACYIQF
jgi:hypothetical protein